MTTLNGNFTVTVKPAAGSPAPPAAPPASGGAQPFTMTPLGGNLPAENQGVADEGDLVCSLSGGVSPYQVSVTAGSLPPGMGLTNETNPDGSVSIFIEGTPTQSGAFSFTLTAVDAAGTVAAPPAAS